MPNFATGTNEIAKVLAESHCLSIVGGGDSVTAVNQAGVADKLHISPQEAEHSLRFWKGKFSRNCSS